MSKQATAQSAAAPDNAGDKGPRRAKPERALNLDELTELFDLVDSHGYTEFELEREGFRVRLSRAQTAPPVVAPLAVAAPPSVAAPVPHAPPHPGAEAEKAASADEDLHIIKSPIVGTFYRSPSPTADSFVKIGSRVTPDSVVCIIEAMKLMNEIQAETSGEIAKIYLENGQPVEYGQPLFGIKK